MTAMIIPARLLSIEGFLARLEPLGGHAHGHRQPSQQSRSECVMRYRLEAALDHAEDAKQIED
jgi:hypothetical protein